MAKNSLLKKQRHLKLFKRLKEDPFLTDEDIATELNVSVPTIRLDRMELGIPELRQRIKNVASETISKVKSLSTEEIIGELVDIQLGERGIAILETTDEMVFKESKVVRGNFIYSFAESIAISVIDAKVALVGVANIKYKTPVYSGTKLIAKAEVRKKREKNYIVWVFIYENQKEVFRGKFLLVSMK